MSLRLVCGRSGSGKSEFCLEEIIDKIKNKDDKVYIITPEQFSYSVEKKLMDKQKTGAILNSEVLTFKRMAYRVASKVGGVTDLTLSKTGKAMILYNIILENKDSLQFLGKSEQNVDLASRALTEFKKHNITLENLKNVIENEEDRYLKEKLKDLYYIYDKFEETLSEKYIDENDLLTILADNLDKTDMFKNSIIYIDEFTGYTKQEYKLIEKLLKTAKEITITVTTDNLDMGTNQDTDIFYSNKQTADKLLYLARNNKIECEKTVFLNDLKRFKNDELKHIEQNLFKIPANTYEEEIKDLNLFLAFNTYSEVENAAKEISKLVKNEEYRYRDISVITKNLDTYSSLIKVIFRNYNIPVFIDEKRDLSTNIFIQYIISILEVFNRNWSYDSVMNYIKTAFVNLDDDDIYIFENYCKKWGIKGSKWYKGEWNFEEITDKNKEEIEKVISLRKTITKPLQDFKDRLQKNKTVETITKELYNFLIENKIDYSLVLKKSKLEYDGFIELANEQELAWNIIIQVMDELVNIFKDEKISFDKYIKLLRIGLNANGLGIIPQTQDQVIIGDVERSRSHKVKAIFILGMNDGVFPTIQKDEGFLGDKDRERLKQEGIELAKGTIDALYEDNFSIYKAFTTAEDKLFLSYSSSDMEGASLRPSMYIKKIKKIFTKLEENSDLVYKPSGVLVENLAFDELIKNLRLFRDGESIDKKWFQIYNYFAEKIEWKDKLEGAIKALNYTNQPDKISKANIDKLYGKTLNTTVSRLEQYRKCPFSYYLKYGLKIKDEDKFEVDVLDTGNFMHDIIDTFFKTLQEEELNVKELSYSQIQKIVDQIIEEKLQASCNYILTSTDKFKVLTNRLKRVVKKSIIYIVDSLKYSDFNVLGTEVEFKEGKEYKPILIELDDGKKVEITGKIDRIDLAENQDGKFIRIIDYKSSVRNLDLNEVVAGLQIQLLTYLDAACKDDDISPAGVLYFPLIDPIVKSKKTLTNEEIEQEIRKNFKMKGLIVADVNVVRMMDKTLNTGYSTIIPVQITSNDDVGARSSTVTKQQFSDLQKYITKTIKDISNEILSGKIDIEPYCKTSNKKTPCKYCEYKTICQFRPGENKNSYNYISKKEKADILEEIKNIK